MVTRHPRGKLGGMIFMANQRTFKECLDRMLFGLPLNKLYLVRQIAPSTPLFLFDTQSRQLYGVFLATTWGGENLEPGAWMSTAGQAYPSQIRVQLYVKCNPLAESQFGVYLEYNDVSRPSFFNQALNQNQVGALLMQFKPCVSGEERVLEHLRNNVFERQRAGAAYRQPDLYPRQPSPVPVVIPPPHLISHEYAAIDSHPQSEHSSCDDGQEPLHDSHHVSSDRSHRIQELTQQVSSLTARLVAIELERSERDNKMAAHREACQGSVRVVEQRQDKVEQCLHTLVNIVSQMVESPSGACSSLEESLEPLLQGMVVGAKVEADPVENGA